MDEPLLAAFRYADPGPTARRISRGALRARARVVALLPPRRRPRYIKDLPRIRSYPDGYRLSDLGTFAPGCPVPHGRADAG